MRRTETPKRLTVVVTSPDSARLSARGLGRWLEHAAPAGARGEVTVALVSDRRMRSLNRTFRGHDYATDVLSFPVAHGPRKARVARARPTAHGEYDGSPDGLDSLGDVVIATGVAKRQAKEAGHPVGTEFRVLALHGLLHLLGYDHDRDNGQMQRAERRLRRAAGLREGLIERGKKGR